MPSRAAQPPENFAIPDTASKGVEPTQQDSTSRFEKLMQDPRGQAFLAQASLSLLGSQHDRGGFGRQVSDAVGAGGEAAGRVQKRQDVLEQQDVQNEAQQQDIALGQQRADAQTSLAASQATEVENRQKRSETRAQVDLLSAQMTLELGLAQVTAAEAKLLIDPLIEEILFNTDDEAERNRKLLGVKAFTAKAFGKQDTSESRAAAINAKPQREAVAEIERLLRNSPTLGVEGAAAAMIQAGMNATWVNLAKQNIAGGS